MKKFWKITGVLFNIITICAMFAIVYVVHIERGDRNARIVILESKVQILEQKIKPTKVTVTAYSPRESETDSTPYITAFQTRVRPGIIAVSRDLFKKGWVEGRKVYIDQFGVFVIQDLMHHRKRQQLDIFFYSTKEAKKFGVQKTTAILLNI